MSQTGAKDPRQVRARAREHSPHLSSKGRPFSHQSVADHAGLNHSYAKHIQSHSCCVYPTRRAVRSLPRVQAHAPAQLHDRRAALRERERERERERRKEKEREREGEAPLLTQDLPKGGTLLGLSGWRFRSFARMLETRFANPIWAGMGAIA